MVEVRPKVWAMVWSSLSCTAKAKSAECTRQGRLGHRHTHRQIHRLGAALHSCAEELVGGGRSRGLAAGALGVNPVV